MVNNITQKILIIKIYLHTLQLKLSHVIVISDFWICLFFKKQTVSVVQSRADLPLAWLVVPPPLRNGWLCNKSYFFVLNMNSVWSELSFEVYNVSLAQNLTFWIFLSIFGPKIFKISNFELNSCYIPQESWYYVEFRFSKKKYDFL